MVATRTTYYGTSAWETFRWLPPELQHRTKVKDASSHTEQAISYPYAVPVLPPDQALMAHVGQHSIKLQLTFTGKEAPAARTFCLSSSHGWAALLGCTLTGLLLTFRVPLKLNRFFRDAIMQAEVCSEVNRIGFRILQVHGRIPESRITCIGSFISRTYSWELSSCPMSGRLIFPLAHITSAYVA